MTKLTQDQIKEIILEIAECERLAIKMDRKILSFKTGEEYAHKAQLLKELLIKYS